MEWPSKSKTESKAPSGRFFYFIKKTHTSLTKGDYVLRHKQAAVMF